MQQLYVRWMILHWMQKCHQKCQELLKLFAVPWRAPVTGDVNISTTSQLSQNHANFTTTDRPISTSRQTVNITTNQVRNCSAECFHCKHCDDDDDDDEFVMYSIIVDDVVQIWNVFGIQWGIVTSSILWDYNFILVHRCWWMRWEQRRMQSICYLYQRTWQFHLPL